MNLGVLAKTHGKTYSAVFPRQLSGEESVTCELPGGRGLPRTRRAAGDGDGGERGDKNIRSESKLISGSID